MLKVPKLRRINLGILCKQVRKNSAWKVSSQPLAFEKIRKKLPGHGIERLNIVAFMGDTAKKHVIFRRSDLRNLNIPLNGQSRSERHAGMNRKRPKRRGGAFLNYSSASVATSRGVNWKLRLWLKNSRGFSYTTFRISDSL